MCNPVHVTYVANSAKIGGGNRVLMDLASRLDPTRFIPTMIAPDHGALGDWAAAHHIRCTVVPAANDGRVATLRRVGAILNVLRADRTCLLHANSPHSYRAAGVAARLTGVRRICHVHSSPSDAELDWCFRSGPERVITCYEEQAREVTAALGRVRRGVPVTAISNAIDIRAYAPALVRRASDGRQRFGADHVVLIIGNLSDLKGYPTFIRAAARLADRFPRAAYVSLGEETVEAGAQLRLQALASELGIADRVHFLGWRADVAEVIHSADVMALPSRVEGLPIAVLEAMACGKPVVASRVNGVPEAVIDGVTGLLVPPDDPETLTCAIAQLLSDPGRAARMGAEGRRRAESEFSLDRYVERTQLLYEAVLAPGEPAAERHP